MRTRLAALVWSCALACSSNGGVDGSANGDSLRDGDGNGDGDGQVTEDNGDPAASDGAAPTDDSPPPDRYVYVSGRGGLQRFRFNPTTAALTLLDTTPAGTNPSFLAISQTRRVVYVADEASQEARAFKMANDASLTPLGTKRSTSGGTAFIGLDRSESVVMVANYNEGTIGVFGIEAGGGIAASPQMSSAGANAHAIVEGPVSHMVYVPCLGDDKVAQYTLAAGALTAHGQAMLATDAGPRHIAFHPSKSLAYVLNELNSTLVAFTIASDGALTDARTPVSTLPAGFTDANSGAEVQVAPSGNFVYTSNRGRNSVAIFAVAASGAVTLASDESTRGDKPRHFSIDPTGTWLLVANQDSDNVSVFGVDATSGGLTYRTTVSVGDEPQFVTLVPEP